jgi:hypothetical protein
VGARDAPRAQYRYAKGRGRCWTHPVAILASLKMIAWLPTRLPFGRI